MNEKQIALHSIEIAQCSIVDWYQHNNKERLYWWNRKKIHSNEKNNAHRHKRDGITFKQNKTSIFYFSQYNLLSSSVTWTQRCLRSSLLERHKLNLEESINKAIFCFDSWRKYHCYRLSHKLRISQNVTMTQSAAILAMDVV